MSVRGDQLGTMDTAAARQLRAYRRVPAPLGLVVFLAQIGLGIALFAVFQQYVPEGLGAGDGWGGYLLGMYGGARFLCETPTGALADRLRRRSALLVGFIFLLPAMGAMAAVDEPAIFIGLAALLGLGTAFIWPAAYAICADLYPAEQRGKVIGFLNLCQLLGFGLGALIGALLVDHHPTAMIVVGIATIAGAACVGSIGIPAYDSGAVVANRERRPALREVWSGQMAGLCALVLVATTAVAMLVPAIRVFGNEQLDISFAKLTIALIPAVFLGAALYIPAGHAADRFGRTAPFLAGQVLLVVGLLTVSETRSVGVAAVAAGVIFAGNVFSVPAFNAAVMDLAPESHRGTIIGLTVALSGLGLAVGPAVGGAIAGSYGAPAVFRLAALVSGVAGVGIYAYSRRYGARQPVRAAPVRSS